MSRIELFWLVELSNVDDLQPTHCNGFDSGTDAWRYSIDAYENAGLSWTMWSYKAATGTSPTSWGWFYPVGSPSVPDIQNDSADAIAAAWRQWRTGAAFTINSAIGR